MFSGEGIFAYSYGTFRSYGSPADLLCGRIGAFDEAGCVRRFLNGAKDGMRTVIGIVPTLIGLMAAVGVLRSSGFLEDFGNLLGTVLEPTGIPSALVPLSVVRLFSNSAAVSLCWIFTRRRAATPLPDGQLPLSCRVPRPFSIR